MVENKSATTEAFERAANLIKIHGIISIIVGALGILVGLGLLLLFAVLSTFSAANSDVIFFFVIGLLALIFFILPHVYLIVSGIQLYNQPEPRVARILVIINLVIGVLWGNVFLLVFAILNLVQMNDYEKGYKKPVKK